jgi:pyruvate/2-oxoglutarate dehydrogenase complex dihydrolipoamide acyltransferase (E2) component
MTAHGRPTPEADVGAASPSGVGRPLAATPADSPRLKASPAARRLAAERGVDLAALAGSGPGGRIVEADVLAAAPRTATSGGDGAPEAVVPWRVRERIPLTGVRGAVARRLRQVMETAVPLTLTREVRADVLREARARFVLERGELPWDAVFVKLLADALRARPALNAVVAGEEIVVCDEVHVGFAVPLADGLVVPVVRDAAERPLAAVAATVQQLGERARAGRLAAQDLLGTATVSNLGAHGVDAFTPVLNPPQSVVLGVGRMAVRPVVAEGRVVAATTCVLSLTFDHRVADGVPAAELLAAIATGVEEPSWIGREPAKVGER